MFARNAERSTGGSVPAPAVPHQPVTYGALRNLATAEFSECRLSPEIGSAFRGRRVRLSDWPPSRVAQDAIGDAERSAVLIGKGQFELNMGPDVDRNDKGGLRHGNIKRAGAA